MRRLSSISSIMDCFFFLIWLGFSLLGLAACVWSLYDQLTFIQRAPTAIVKGKITDVTWSHTDSTTTCSSSPSFSADGSFQGSSFSCSSTGSSDTCEARVRFSPDRTQGIEITSQCYGQVSGMVDVAYHTADPRDARVIPPGGFLLGNWEWFVAFLVALLFSGIGITSLLSLLGTFMTSVLARAQARLNKYTTSKRWYEG